GTAKKSKDKEGSGSSSSKDKAKHRRKDLGRQDSVDIGGREDLVSKVLDALSERLPEFRSLWASKGPEEQERLRRAVAADVAASDPITPLPVPEAASPSARRATYLSRSASQAEPQTPPQLVVAKKEAKRPCATPPFLSFSFLFFPFL